jgi:hypothetical protein
LLEKLAEYPELNNEDFIIFRHTSASTRLIRT